MSLSLQTKQLSWQAQLAEAVTNPLELCELLQLDSARFAKLHAASEFVLRVPRGFVARMQKANLEDPLLKQVLPLAQEAHITPGYSHDPLQEKQANLIPGLLHKYHGRVLLLLAGGCAINCRYCFRRHFAYNENMPGKGGWENVLRYIAADPTIAEVIYSGGDPLVVKDAMLAALTEKIAAIPHVTSLRIHTRLPIVIPQRINSALLAWLSTSRLRPIMVIHCNHPNEIDGAVISAIHALRTAGVMVLNQTVLLKGVNDHAAILIALSKKLFSAGVLPYYLHLLDVVQGAAHFAVPAATAQRLVGQMMSELPGYLVPRLVQEKPKAVAKSPLLPIL